MGCLHPEKGCEKNFGHPFRVRTVPTHVPEVFTTFRPPATFFQPFGLQTLIELVFNPSLQMLSGFIRRIT